MLIFHIHDNSFQNEKKAFIISFKIIYNIIDNYHFKIILSVNI